MESRTPSSIGTSLGRWSRKWELPGAGLLALLSAGIILTWKLPVVAPDQPGGDHDYWYLINLAARRGLDFGHDVSTTYGPLFFLTVPSVDSPRQIVAAFVTWFFVSLFVGSALFQAFRKYASPRLAVVCVLLILVSGGLTPLSSVITMSFVFVALLGLLYGARALPLWADRSFPAFAAAVTAAMALNKFSVAGMCGAAAVAALLSRGPRWRRIAEFAVVGVVVSCLLWIVVGQPLFSLPTYVLHALSVGSGQSGAMGLELTDNAWEYVLLLPALGAIVGLLVTMRPRGWWSIPYWLCHLAAAVLLFKQAFVRHDAHSAQFFAYAACAAVVLLILGNRAWGKRGLLAGGLTALLLATQLGAYGDGLDAIDPSRRVASFGGGIVYVVSPDSRASALASARENLVNKLQIPASLTDAIGDQQVYVEPFNYAAGFAYDFSDAVLPTLLEYGAYNTALDGLNTEWFSGANAPTLILRQLTETTLDGRNPQWDAPNQKLAERCLYHETLREGNWALLERNVSSVCAVDPVAQPVEEVEAGQSVTVPSKPGYLTVARVIPDVDLDDRLLGALFKREDLFVSFKGKEYRFPWGHSGSPILVSDGEAEGEMLSMNRAGTVQFEFIEICPLR